MTKVLKSLLIICFTAITLTACGVDSTTPDTSTTDTTPPTVSSSSPATNSTGIAVNTAIIATFSETVDASTINTATFDVSGVTGTVTCNGPTATFTPSSNLASNTTYTGTISTGIKDSSGNAMASDYTWTFTTGTASDTAPPTVSSTNPANNASGIAVNATITATFSEIMDASSLNANTFTIPGVTGTVTYNGATATFTPSSNLSFNTSYTAIISTGVKDSSGNAMASNYTWSFTTGSASDTTPPTVSSTNPANNATGVAVNTAITATFSEIMAASTINTATFTIAGITGTVTYNGATATFTPSVNLAYSTTYTATVTTGVKDSSGNAMASNYTWSFSTNSYTSGSTSGSLDPTFGAGGIVTTDIGSDNYGEDLIIQSDGKIVAAGSSNSDFALVRYNADATLDATFGTGGIVTTDIGNSFNSAIALGIQSDGRIVAAGYGNSDFALVRYNTDGSLDTTFGASGIVTITNIGIVALGIQSDGKIVAAGYYHNGSNNDFALVRHNVDGSLDTTFGTGGIVTTDIGNSGSSDIAQAMGIQPDGKIVSAGSTDGDVAVVRYNIDGSLDTTFDADGVVTTAIGTGSDDAYALGIQPDGKIITAGFSVDGSNYDFALVRYNADGILDSTFGAGGVVTTAIGSGTDVALALGIQSDGKIVAAGAYSDGSKKDFALVRYNVDGTLDSTFGTGGIVTTDTGSVSDADTDTAHALDIQSDGKIVVAGDSNSSNSDFVIVVRYLP